MDSTRIRNALQDRILLVDVDVRRTDHHIIVRLVGKTGRIYTVEFTINQEPTCTCPDHKYRQVQCKHILFILLKVFGLPHTRWQDVHDFAAVVTKIRSRQHHPEVVAVSATPAEHKYIHHIMSQHEKRNNPKKAKTKTLNKVPRNEECGICLETINLQNEAFGICDACHNGWHAICYKRWKEVSHRSVCIFCRKPQIDLPKVSKKQSEGHTDEYAVVDLTRRLESTHM